MSNGMSISKRIYAFFMYKYIQYYFYKAESCCCMYNASVLFETIIHAYRQNEYHNLYHIYYMIRNYRKYNYTEEYALENNRVIMAIILHDVYDDIALCKELVSECFRYMIDAKVIARYIQSTDYSSHNIIKSIVSDLDLLILGQTEDVYKEYAMQIKAESIRKYNIDEETYYKNRKILLESFLNMRSIYTTAAYKIKYEESARKNIKNELYRIELLINTIF